MVAGVQGRWARVALVPPLFTCLLAVVAHATPRAAVIPTSPAQLVALDGGYLRRYAAPDWTPLPPVPSPGLRSLAVGADGQLYGLRADRVLRLDGALWRQVASFAQRVEQIVPAPDGSRALVVLTGRPDEPVLADSRVWRLDLGTGRVTWVEAVRDAYRPWHLGVSRVDDEPRLAVSTYRATRFWPEPHRCHFLYRWQGDLVEPVWLGSRLSRPYLQVAHADLRGDGRWRMVGLEHDQDEQPSLTVYQAIGFGYEGEWRSDVLPGAAHVAAIGGQVVVLAPDQAWRVVVDGQGYRLAPLSPVPPSLDGLVEWDGRLWGQWEGQVHLVRGE
ncbi:MAG: hypothetical protein HZB16_08920 [Armatimonadetes bacterium]|nr:hypothetical protein [Armatimonadota bacterium]